MLITQKSQNWHLAVSGLKHQSYGGLSGLIFLESLIIFHQTFINVVEG